MKGEHSTSADHLYLFILYVQALSGNISKYALYLYLSESVPLGTNKVHFDTLWLYKRASPFYL